MEKITYNGIEFMVDVIFELFSESLEKANIEYEIKEVPVEFITKPFTHHFLNKYKYKSVKEIDKTVYVIAIETFYADGDNEGGHSYIFQTYQEINFETAKSLEDDFYKRKIKFSDKMEYIIYG